MKRIDFMGAPGIGKTTLFNELNKFHSRSKKWLTIQEAKVYIANGILSDHFLSIVNLKKFLINAARPKGLQKQIVDNVLSSAATDALLLKQSEWSRYLEFCAYQIGFLQKEPIYRIYLAKWLESILSNVALAEEYNSPHKVLFDESLSQRAPGLLPWDHTSCLKECHDYFKLMPAPFAVVHLNAKPEQIAKRIIERSKVITISMQHRGLTRTELLERSKSANAIFQVGAEVLRERGIKVIDLDADKNTIIMVTELKSVLSGL